MSLFLLLNPKQADISDQFKIYGDIDGGWKKKKKHEEEEEITLDPLFEPAIEPNPEKTGLPGLKEKIAEFQASKVITDKLDRDMKSLERELRYAKIKERHQKLELQRQKELQHRREIALEIMKLEEEEAVTLLIDMLESEN